MRRYLVNTDTDRAWHEVCDAQEPHINDVGMPVARVIAELSQDVARGLEVLPLMREIRAKVQRGGDHVLVDPVLLSRIDEALK